MKKIFSKLMFLALAAMTFTACEDVPEPYPIPTNGGNTDGNKGLPYQSANLNQGWTLLEVTTGAQPWSKGSSYAQATGYQKWDGASEKTNKAVEGWLVSPAISTMGYENVKLSFNHTVMYTNKVTGWEAFHKVYAATDFDGTNANTATWKELAFKPVASPYSDWTLYSSGEIQLPAELVGKESVYIGFWFKAPANASTTWELQSFKMEEGLANNSETPEDPTSSEELGTPDAPLTVSKALEIINGYEAAGESKSDAYVKGKIVSVQQYNATYKSITYYISDDGTATNQLQVYSGKGLNGADFASKDDLKPGAVVVVKGKLKKYVQNDKVTPEINQGSTIVSIEGNEGGETPNINGKGTADAPYTVTEAIAVGSGTGVYVKAFIVGSITGKTLADGAVFSADAEVNTNLLIAASVDETNASNCMPVQLPNGAVRSALNLIDNKSNYKKEVILYGNIENYFGAPGLKSVTYAILDGKEIGKKPEGGTDTPSTGEVKKVTIAEFNAAQESNDVWYQITGTVKNLKDNDKYGNFDLEDETGSVYVYGLLSEKDGEKQKFQELAAAKGIKNGSKITIIGVRGSYNGKIEVMNAYFVSIEGEENNTPANEDVKAVSIADFNASSVADDVWYQLTGTVKNLKDNDKYGNFDLEDSTGSVYVYGLLSEKGGEKQKFQELVAAKGIKNGCTLTIIGTRGEYNGKIEVLNAYFVSVSN
jgi:RPA family protein